MSSEANQDIQILTWKIDDQIFGIDVQYVKEVENDTFITILPLAPKTIAGISNIRGDIITILDLNAKLGYNKTTDKKNGDRNTDFTSSIILLKNKYNNNSSIAFKIDELLDILDTNMQELEPPPSNLDIIEMKYISSVISNKTDMIIILNYDGLIKENNSDIK